MLHGMLFINICFSMLLFMVSMFLRYLLAWEVFVLLYRFVGPVRFVLVLKILCGGSGFVQSKLFIVQILFYSSFFSAIFV